ncbi:alternative ribosome rescue aminoacyl-tRNA hydrolase ArfB [Planctobacterium marinum]|uniref:alternative ribosome rescue aminoacyl-tRNA hydrolase ArfB n=1 Tax=Planctobacterium marinum TaxID=1631968 RepID=UPI002B4C2331|nr:alternative ribosome rescue aminoacyl-tRNA hydrolase ArfB [Planctobacterium marinum]
MKISNTVYLVLDEIEISAIRAQGSGGQNVNKVSSAIHLRFDILASSLPQRIKDNLLQRSDSRLTSDGVLVIKAQQFRTQEKNKADAIERLVELIQKANHIPKTRKATKPTKASQKRRVDAKKQVGKNKILRKKVTDY